MREVNRIKVKFRLYNGLEGLMAQTSPESKDSSWKFIAGIVSVVVVGTAIICWIVFWIDSNVSKKRVANLNSLAVRVKSGERIELENLRSILGKEGYDTIRTPINADDQLKCGCDSRWYGLTGHARTFFNKDHDVVIVFDVKDGALVDLQILQHAD